MNITFFHIRQNNILLSLPYLTVKSMNNVMCDNIHMYTLIISTLKKS